MSRPESTVAPMVWLLLGPIKPPLVRFSVSFAVAKLNAIEPFMLSELYVAPPVGIAALAVIRIFLAALLPASRAAES